MSDVTTPDSATPGPEWGPYPPAPATRAPGEFAREVTELDRLKPEPPTVELTDGRVVPLLYDMEALAWFERRVGSLAALEGIGSFDRPVIEPLIYVLAAGMIHREDLNVRVLRRDHGDGDVRQEVLVGDTRLIRLLDVVRLRDYIKAVDKALSVALPWGKAVAAAAAGAGERSTGSTGSASTTPAPSHSVAPTPSSGA